MYIRIDLVTRNRLVRLQSCRPLLWIERNLARPPFLTKEEKKLPLVFRPGR
jgi:hypothetical protein